MSRLLPEKQLNCFKWTNLCLARYASFPTCVLLTKCGSESRCSRFLSTHVECDRSQASSSQPTLNGTYRGGDPRHQTLLDVKRKSFKSVVNSETSGLVLIIKPLLPPMTNLYASWRLVLICHVLVILIPNLRSIQFVLVFAFFFLARGFLKAALSKKQ